jgi:NAD(P)-dependent dehydrogenase (short-subunit alcohol dehydrogenase family)
MTDRSLLGRVALVTGAGSGLGAATACALAQHGARVACLDLDEARARQTAAAIEGSGQTARGMRCDVSNPRDVQAAVSAIARSCDAVDIAVNCAGVDYVLSVDELTIEQWDRVLGVNLRGPFLVAKSVLPAMRERGGGDIVNVASTAAVRAWGSASAYHASKWGLVGFSRGLGVEGRPHGVRVTTIIPGGMHTHWFDRFPEQGIPLPDEQNLQDPRNVAEAILAAITMPPGSVVQEIIVTPLTETSWP